MKHWPLSCLSESRPPCDWVETEAEGSTTPRLLSEDGTQCTQLRSITDSSNSPSNGLLFIMPTACVPIEGSYPVPFIRDALLATILELPSFARNVLMLCLGPVSPWRLRSATKPQSWKRLTLLRALFTFWHRRKSTNRQGTENTLPRNEDPFHFRILRKAWAGVDDCGFNDSVVESRDIRAVFDSLRLRAACRAFPDFLRAGGWIELGATHFQTLHEIPYLTRYEMRLSIASWNETWMFLILRFVEPSTVVDTRTYHERESTAKLLPVLDGAEALPPIPFQRIGKPDGVRSVPRLCGAAVDGSKSRTVLGQKTIRERDGASVRCISVFAIAFKHGNAVVPPSLALCAEGFAGDPITSEKSPHYRPHVQALRGSGNIGEFLRSGWRDVPKQECWWEHALEGAEGDRAERLACVQELRYGSAAAQALL
ncbi:hypothetical protein BC834DRAFT_861422 [Gloeopeniophorella convolvens]|nr:hypothetical protein BC834DRAFT_861422 [Gloeopeniophorella convolvens]